MSYILGIDLGVTGAIAAIGPNTSQVVDLPITEDDTGKRLDARAFVHAIRAMVPAGHCAIIVMENVHVMRVAGRAMSHKTESTLVGLRYAVQAAADIARIPVHLVSPQAWKKHFGIKADKTGSVAREKAAALYPGLAGRLARVKDHNRGDAVLLAHWGKGSL